ncbi:hypothetical protein [Paenibacillus sp. GCM10027626]
MNRRQNPEQEHWTELTELIHESYLRMAPKRLVKSWLAERQKDCQ